MKTIMAVFFIGIFIVLIKTFLPQIKNFFEIGTTKKPVVDNRNIVSMTVGEIEALISSLKVKLENAEILAKHGVESAKRDVEKYEEQLRVANEAKNRYKNL